MQSKYLYDYLKNTHTHTHGYTHARICTHTNKHTHTYTRTPTHTHTHKHAHAYTQACTHAGTHTHTHTPVQGDQRSGDRNAPDHNTPLSLRLSQAEGGGRREEGKLRQKKLREGEIKAVFTCTHCPGTGAGLMRVHVFTRGPRCRRSGAAGTGYETVPNCWARVHTSLVPRPNAV